MPFFLAQLVTLADSERPHAPASSYTAPHSSAQADSTLSTTILCQVAGPSGYLA